MCVCCVCVCVCVDVYNDMMYLILPLHMHISGDGGVVLVDLKQEPHRDQDWSELLTWCCCNHTSVCCSKHVEKLPNHDA